MALVLGELSTILSANMDGFRKDLNRAKQYFKEHGAELQQRSAVVGAAIGAALGAGLLGALELDKAQAKLSAQLGGSAQYAADMGKIAGSVYMRGFGESASAVGETLRGVLTSGLIQEDAADEEIEALVLKAQSLADVFGQDVTQTARAAGQMIRTGLAKDANEAFDLLTRGFQQSGDHAGDLLDTVSEYSTKFRDLGLDGSQALGLLQQGLKAGARDADTVADALKEFAIRAVDGSEASAEGFKALGLDAEKLTAQIAKGGDGAKAGLDTVLDRLRAMKDPVAQDAAAVALFGTKAEDLGDSLFALDVDKAAYGLGKVEGAATKLGATMEGSASQKLESFKRQAQAALVEKMAAAVPYIQSTVEWLGKHSAIVGPLVTVLGTLAAIIGVIIGVTKVWTIVQTALNIVMSLNPLGLILIAIIALIAGIVLLWKNSETFRNIVTGVFSAVWSAIKFVWDWIKKHWVLLLSILTGPIGAAVIWIIRHWDQIKAGAAGAVKWIKDKFNALLNFVTGLPERVAKAASGLWDGLKNSFKTALNWLIGKWNNFSLTLGGGSVLGLGIPSVTLNTPDIPYLARGGLVPATPGGRIVGVAEGGEAEAIAPLSELVGIVRDAVAGAAGGDTHVYVEIDGQQLEGRIVRVSRREIGEHNRDLRRRVGAGTGALA